MATQWHIDMGFDLNAIVNSTTGYAPLQWGIVNCNSNPGTMAGLNDVQNGDTITFYIFDVTALSGTASSNSSPSFISGTTWITCGAADGNTNVSSPFSNFTALQSGSISSQLTGASSTVFNNDTLPGWQISPSGNVVWTPNTPGTFYFTLAFQATGTINGNSVTKKFYVDPTMIVDPSAP